MSSWRPSPDPGGDWVPAETIDEVLERLSDFIAECRATGSRMGFFPALYRRVTATVQQRISEGFFDDAGRMERLVVVFANRYLIAVHTHENGLVPSRAWRYSFDVARNWRPIVLQHLLLGMHAHISLDLGVSAATVAPGDQLPGLKADFIRINDVLASLVDDVRDELARVWTVLRVFNRYLSRTEKTIINFSMEVARSRAWSTAERLAPLPPDELEEAIKRIDFEVAAFGRAIRHPGITMSVVNFIIRVGERGGVRDKIIVLAGPDDR